MTTPQLPVCLKLLSLPEIKLAGQQLSFSNHVDMIHDSLWAINGFIKPATALASEQPELEKWLHDVNDAIASIENILEVLQKEQKQEVTPPPPPPILLHGSGISSPSTLCRSSRRLDILNELKQITQSLNCLFSRVTTFGLQIDMINSMDPNQVEYYSILLQEVPQENYEIVKKIVILIFQIQVGQPIWDINEDVPFAVAITGGAETEKSILARMVYHHPLVRDFFERRIWVDVSSCADDQQIANECVRRLIERIPKDTDIWSLIRTSLPQTSYLLVLDGINEVIMKNKDKWEELKKNLLSSSPRGSRIIITYQSSDIIENDQEVHFDKV